MNQPIKAIETVYRGYRFRSRLEARWAVFFDALAIQYEYEREGFELSRGRRYLPDFWLPTYKRWVEIKGQVPDIPAFAKCEELAQRSGYEVWILAGSPWPQEYHIITCPEERCATGIIDACWAECMTCGGLWIVQYDETAMQPFNPETCADHIENLDYLLDYDVPRIMAALTAGRRARFEHGESGARP